MNLRIGTAGWSIPREFKNYFPEEESQLISYAKVFNCVEINSTFSKIHLPGTFEKWGLMTPDEFQFSLKLHRSFTHECKLNPGVSNLRNNLRLMGNLGDKWKVLLIQFPGKQDFQEKKMGRFYELIRKDFSGAIVLEPRNLSWLSKESQTLMKEFKVSKVMADPERCPHDSRSILTTGGISYIRLHGSPEIYRSSYTRPFLKDLQHEMDSFKKAWCIFDNTTLGKATGNALTLKRYSA